jgi:hypothetical protein
MDDSGKINGLTVLTRRLELDLVRRRFGRFIQPISQSAYDFLNFNLPIRLKNKL